MYLFSILFQIQCQLMIYLESQNIAFLFSCLFSLSKWYFICQVFWVKNKPFFFIFSMVLNLFIISEKSMWFNVFLPCVHFTSWNSRQPNKAASLTWLITHVSVFSAQQSYQQKPIMNPKFDCQASIKNYGTALQNACFRWFLDFLSGLSTFLCLQMVIPAEFNSYANMNAL